MMNRSQEEMAVIAFLALLWVGKLNEAPGQVPFLTTACSVLLVGWKSFASTKGTGAGTEDVVIPSRDPCLQDGVYCVYEDYYHW